MSNEREELLSVLNQLDDAEPKTRDEYIRLPFAYPGSKFKSLKYILPKLPYRKVFVEPFGGSAAVLLNRQPSKLEVYNDRYGGIVALMRVIRDKDLMERFLDRISLVFHSREEWIWCAETWENAEDDVERAARWYYMMIFSFGCVGRNFGRQIRLTNTLSRKYFNGIPDFYPVYNRLKFVTIENIDWLQCLKDYDSEDTVFYIDPPYLDTDAGAYNLKFKYQDHVKLLQTIFELKGFAALSGYPNPLYDSMKWDDRIEWDVDLKLNNDPSKIKTSNTEVLWIKL